MPVVTFSSPLHIDNTVYARLVEVSEKVGPGIPYSRREGECGTCIMKIVSGMESLAHRPMLEDKVPQEDIAGRNNRPSVRHRCRAVRSWCGPAKETLNTYSVRACRSTIGLKT
jgi:ferredoxin